MTVSTIFSTLGILLAILAFLPNEDRDFIKNKFSLTNYIVLSIIFIYINYLIFFDWWFSNFDFINLFIFSGFPYPKTWAYLLSLSTLAWILFKIFYSKFPKKNDSKLISYYENLFYTNNYQQINYLLKRFNKQDIENYFKGKKTSLNSFIVEEILVDGSFIHETSSINSALFEVIFTYDWDDIITTKIYTKYIESEINNANSKLNKIISIHDDNLSFGKKKVPFIEKIMYLESPAVLTAILKNNLNNDLSQLTNLIKIFYLFAEIEIKNDLKNIEFSKINELLVNKIINSEYHYFEKSMFIYKHLMYLLLQKGLKHNESFQEIFKCLVKTTCFINKPEFRHNTELYVKELLEFVLNSYNDKKMEGITRIIDSTFTGAMKELDCKDSRGLIYDIFNNNFKDKELLKHHIIDIIANI